MLLAPLKPEQLEKKSKEMESLGKKIISRSRQEKKSGRYSAETETETETEAEVETVHFKSCSRRCWVTCR